MKKAAVLILLLLLLISMTSCKKPVPEPVLHAYDDCTLPTAEKEALAPHPLTGIPQPSESIPKMIPVAFVIDNFSNALPQYGISQADVVYEIETEANMGITRLYCLKSDIREINQIGPLRAAHEHVLPLIYPFPVIVADISEYGVDAKFETYGYPHLDGSIDSGVAFFDTDRLKTHASHLSRFMDSLSIMSSMHRFNIQYTSLDPIPPLFHFSDGVSPPAGGNPCTAILYSYSDDPKPGVDASREFRYDNATSQYVKWQYGEKTVDAAFSNAPLAFDNVILLIADEEDYHNPNTPSDTDRYLISFRYENGGSGYYCSEGQYQNIRWEKPDNGPLTIYSAETKNEIRLNLGKTYVSVIKSEMANTIAIQ